MLTTDIQFGRQKSLDTIHDLFLFLLFLCITHIDVDVMKGYLFIL